MAIILKELFEYYSLTLEDVKPFLLKMYNIDDIHDDLVLEDDQADHLLYTIYEKTYDDVDINNEDTDEIDDSWDDDFDDEIPDCPPKSQLPYTCGRLSCPNCGQMGNTYTNGTAYCPKCRKWYCYA